MPNNVEVKYSFEDIAEELNEDSEELNAYKKFFDEKILPAMIDAEKRKSKAIEEAYRIRIC